MKILSLVILHCPFTHPPFTLLPQLLQKRLQNLSKLLSREQFPPFHALSKRLTHTPQHCLVMPRMQVSCPTSLYWHFSHSLVIEKNDTPGHQPSATDVDESEEEGSAELKEMDEQELSVLHVSCKQVYIANWHSPVYGFFKSKVVIDYDNSCKFHFFQCAAKHCKGKVKGIHHYQDLQDRAATSNLKTHATKCFGTDAVKAAFN